MARLCEERVVIVTGAGRGIGREHALALAAAGARVVVNDIGTALNGEGASQTPAEEVVAEIVAAGGQAIANADDIADWAGSERLVQQAISAFGRLDAVVNNAGFVRDRMFVSASEDEWDAVVRVHMKGHFCVARHAAAHWRDAAKAGAQPSGRIINTSSGAGIWGSVGQAAYSAAKAGIAALTMVQSAELGRYGATSNAIAPIARTRMTEGVFSGMMARPEDGFDAMHPGNVSPLIVWLASEASAHCTGRIFEVTGGRVTLLGGMTRGPERDIAQRWEPADLGAAVTELLAEQPAQVPVYGAK
jgi:NAD(P)-dependent dehydrogenase (short-subunit alcohol dehydrogenase family)